VVVRTFHNAAARTSLQRRVWPDTHYPPERTPYTDETSYKKGSWIGTATAIDVDANCIEANWLDANA
jgi:hypothetical protein